MKKFWSAKCHDNSIFRIFSFTSPEGQKHYIFKRSVGTKVPAVGSEKYVQSILLIWVIENMSSDAF